LPQADIATLTGMTDQLSQQSVTTDPARVVETFLYALRDKDFDAADAALDDDLVYQNVGLPTIRGRRRTMNLMRGLDRPSAGFDVKIHRIAAEGSAVLTERTDVIMFGPFRPHFWVCGVFEVRDGRITLWRDYFDFVDILKGSVRALAAIAIPTLRRSL
jgi:limonene-1,2-epoxide hydrolase